MQNNGEAGVTIRRDSPMYNSAGITILPIYGEVRWEHITGVIGSSGAIDERCTGEELAARILEEYPDVERVLYIDAWVNVPYMDKHGLAFARADVRRIYGDGEPCV